MSDRYNRNRRRLCSDDRARGRADRAKVRSGRRVRQIGAGMELHPEEDDRKEQRQYADSLRLGLHVINKTKLRPEWLQGQARKP
jgi:hypothetical protein